MNLLFLTDDELINQLTMRNDLGETELNLLDRLIKATDEIREFEVYVGTLENTIKRNGLTVAPPPQ